VSVYMLHDLGRLDLKPEAAGFRIVVYGHSHKPKTEEKNGVLYFQSRQRRATAIQLTGECREVGD